MKNQLETAINQHKTFNSAEEAKAYLQAHILIKSEGINDNIYLDQLEWLGFDIYTGSSTQWNTDNKVEKEIKVYYKSKQLFHKKWV